MGANHLATAATLILQTPPPDNTDRLNLTAQVSDTFPSDRVTPGFGLERPSDLFQYNRVQGVSLGIGYRLPLGSGPTLLYTTLRYGLSDDRVTARLTLAREIPPGRLAMTGYRDLADVDPYSPGRTLSNTLNSLFVGHDYGDYYLAQGGSAMLERRVGAGLDLALTLRVERQSSVAAVAQSEINDFLGGSGVFPPNRGIDEGVFGVMATRLGGGGKTRWNLTADVLGGEGELVGRLFGELRRSFGWRRALTLRIKAGAGTEPGLPQTLFRLGGLHTVRGFEYGMLRGAAVWAAQADIAPLGGRVRPVVFVDAGQTSTLSGLFSSAAYVGGGVGISVFRGLVRLDFSQPITPDVGGKVRFDIVIRGVM